MSGWGWLLIFLGIVLVGAGWLGYLLWELKFKAEKVGQLIEPVLAQTQTLVEALESHPLYNKPANNLDDDPIEMTNRWLKLRGAREQKREAKKRRLIARLSTRK